eukprot:UN27506
MLGHLGTDYLAAVALAGVWTWGIAIIAFSGMSVLEMFLSQAYGAKNYKLMLGWLHIGLFVLTFFSVLVAICWWFTGPMLYAFGYDRDITDKAGEYAKWIIFSLFFDVWYFSCRCFMTVQTIVIPDLIVDAINVILIFAFNYILIYGVEIHGTTYFKLGFQGSPIARGISCFIRLVMYCVYCLGIKKYHKKLTPDINLLDFTMVSKTRTKKFSS